MPIDSITIKTLGLDRTIAATVNGRQNGVKNDPAWDAHYHPCTEAYPLQSTGESTGESFLEGTVTKYADWSESKIYPNTTRDIWIYRPAQISTSPRVIFFNDGAWYLSRQGPVRATHVLDTLLQQQEIEPTVAIFTMPATPNHDVRPPIESYDRRASQRSLEYDLLSPDYGEFLFDELMPFAEKELNLKFSTDPTHRTTCGISSGGIGAFTAAWHHPDQCQRVLSHCGSFTDIWGGHNYPSIIRQNAQKPIRVFLQSGSNDANTPFGNWALANQAMDSAFQWAGYDYKFEFGTGGHNLDHGGAIFADSLRWLWRD